MKKFISTAVIILSVGLAMVLVGSILQGITWNGDFDGTNLAGALVNLGYIGTMLSGVVLAGLGVATAIKGESKDENKK